MKNPIVNSIAFLVCALTYTAQAQAGPVRFRSIMKNDSSVKYTILISAENEVVKVESAWGMFTDGAKSANGTFKASLLAVGQQQPSLQSVALHSGKDGQFHATNSIAEILYSQSKTQPDVLKVEQYADSNGVGGRLFFIQKDRLVPITFNRKGKTSIEEYWMWKGLKRLSATRFQSVYYDNSEGFYHRTSWIFEPKKRQMKMLRASKSKDAPQ